MFFNLIQNDGGQDGGETASNATENICPCYYTVHGMAEPRSSEHRSVKLSTYEFDNVILFHYIITYSPINSDNRGSTVVVIIIVQHECV